MCNSGMSISFYDTNLVGIYEAPGETNNTYTTDST